MAQLDLVFSLDERAPLELVFNDDGSAPAQEYTLHSAGQITGLRGHAALHVGHRLHSAGVLTGLRGHCTLGYDSNVDRPLFGRGQARWQRAEPIAAPVRTHYQLSEPLYVGGRALWQPAQPILAGARNHWQRSIELAAGGQARWQYAKQIAALAQARFQHTIELSTSARQHWQLAQQLAILARARFQYVISLEMGASARWQFALPILAAGSARAQRAMPLYGLNQAWWQVARVPPPGSSPKPPKPLDWCYVPANPIELVFEHDDRPPLDLLFWCERHDDGPPDPPATIIVPARRVYIVLNEIEVRRVDGNIPLPTIEASLSIDKDSWTWQMSATMHRAALPNLAPARFGEPVEIEFKVNGAPYRMMVESVQREWQHPTQRIVVKGRGKNAVLDAPYAPSLNFTNSSARTAQQLMVDALTINGVSIGWDVDFGLVDWLVPAGAWVHQGSYISAVTAIAAAAGGYVQPHPTEKILRILPNYPVAPWDWGGIVPNIELPMNPVEVESVEWITKPNYNQVHLMGEVGGAFAEVYRGGTARDLAAEMVVDPLITHADVARQRGRAILSDTGHQAMVRWSLPVLPETGLIMPGQFVRREHEGEVFQGYVRSLNMNWDRPTLRQVIEVQAHG